MYHDLHKWQNKRNQQAYLILSTTLQLEKHLERAHLCQRGHWPTYCDFYLLCSKYIKGIKIRLHNIVGVLWSVPFGLWYWFMIFGWSKSLHHQNVIICSLVHCQHAMKGSLKSLQKRYFGSINMWQITCEWQTELNDDVIWRPFEQPIASFLIEGSRTLR